MSPVARIALGTGAMLVVFAGLLFGSAGRLDLPAFWAYLAIWGVFPAIAYGFASRKHPELLEERMRPPSDRDRLTRWLAAGPALGHMVVAGLDRGRGWLRLDRLGLDGLGLDQLGLGWLGLGEMPLWLSLIGFLGVIVGLGLTAWTVTTNPFASSAVRIQDDRGQTVITHGPYRIVRHPMYFGTVLVAVCGGLALGSWASAALLMLIIPIFVRRTLREDRMLRQELSGYRDYAKRTPWRLIPLLF